MEGLYIEQSIYECDDIFNARIGEQCIVSEDGDIRFPIDGIVPFIIKEIGCIGMVQVDGTDTDKEGTGVSFHFIQKFIPDSPIAKHYWDVYKNMNTATDKDIKELKEYLLPDGFKDAYSFSDWTNN